MPSYCFIDVYPMGNSLYQFRYALFFGQTITRERAIEIAREECAHRRWPFQEPFQLVEGLFTFEIKTNTYLFGANVFITIRTFDGKVLKAIFNRR